MVNVTRRQSESAPLLPSLLGDWDPFANMRQMLRWSPLSFDPFREMLPVIEASPTANTYIPAFEVKEDKEGYSFKADMPGVKDEDLKVTVTDNRLAISGKREEEKKTEDETYYCYERSYGSFNRIFTLPEAADLAHVKAELKGGQLLVIVPKKPGREAKEVNVTVEKGK